MVRDGRQVARDELGKQLCDAFGLDFGQVTRLVIDVDATQPATRVFVQMIDDEELITVGWKDLFAAMDIKFSPKHERKED